MANRFSSLADASRRAPVLRPFGPGPQRAGSSDADGVELSPCGLVPDLVAAQVYNEEAFRYFLEIERRRSAVSDRPFLLLLVDLENAAASRHAAPGHGIDTATATKLFSALCGCVRETDFIGWYRDNQTAGAVLTQHADGPDTSMPNAVRERISTALAESLPADLGSRLRVRVYQVPTAGTDS